jgi:hypothetical protein
MIHCFQSISIDVSDHPRLQSISRGSVCFPTPYVDARGIVELCVNTRQEDENESVGQHLARLARSARHPRACRYAFMLPIYLSPRVARLRAMAPAVFGVPLPLGLCFVTSQGCTNCVEGRNCSWVKVAPLHHATGGRLWSKYRTFIALDWSDSVLYFSSQNRTNFVLRGGKTRLFSSNVQGSTVAYRGGLPISAEHEIPTTTITTCH